MVKKIAETLDNAPTDIVESDVPLVDAEAVADDLNTARSDVQPHIVAEIESHENGTPVDSDGVTFRAGYHAVNDDGTPRLTKTGKFRKARNGQEATPPDVEKSRLNRLNVARVLSAMTFRAGMFFGGTEAAPKKDDAMGLDEVKDITTAYDSYMAAKNIDDLPPGLALFLSLALYAGRVASIRVAQEKSKSIFSRIFKRKKKPEIKNQEGAENAS